jgi:hypothetical protein
MQKAALKFNFAPFFHMLNKREASPRDICHMPSVLPDLSLMAEVPVRSEWMHWITASRPRIFQSIFSVPMAGQSLPKS